MHKGNYWSTTYISNFINSHNDFQSTTIYTPRYFSRVAHATQGFSPFSFAQSTRVSNIMCCLTEHTIVSGDRWLSLQGRPKAAKVQLR